MTNAGVPHFTIKGRFQKGGSYRDVFTKEVLRDICLRITGIEEFTTEFDDTAYNVGRLAFLHWGDKTAYISVSETNIKSRNSSFQSVPSALSRYILDNTKNKEIFYYVHPDVVGNIETDYFMFMYRLLQTVGVKLINIDKFVAKNVLSFVAPEDVIAAKDKLRTKAKGNKSTYITRGEDGAVQVYAKTYGANKYESTLICLALAQLSPDQLELFEIEEGGLKSLPFISRSAILASGAISITSSTAAIEAAEFIENNSLRSVKFIYNLLEKFEAKRCAFCDCQIPQIVQGAHIWPVASIKQEAMTFDEQLGHALNGNNGLWLCENHHKLFDSGMVYIASSGLVKYRNTLPDMDVNFLKKITTVQSLSVDVLGVEFLDYLQKRNEGLLEESFFTFAA